MIRLPRRALSNKREWPKTRNYNHNVIPRPHCRLSTVGMWSQRHKKVLYFKNKCGPVLLGPHFRRYVEQKMWSR